MLVQVCGLTFSRLLEKNDVQKPNQPTDDEQVSRGGALSSHGDLHSNTGGGGVGELSTTAVDRLRRSASGVERMAPGNGGAIIGDGSAVGTGDAQKRMDSWGGRLEKAPPPSSSSTGGATVGIMVSDDIPISNKAWKVLGRSPPPVGSGGIGAGAGVGGGNGGGTKSSVIKRGRSSRNLGDGSKADHLERSERSASAPPPEEVMKETENEKYM